MMINQLTLAHVSIKRVPLTCRARPMTIARCATAKETATQRTRRTQRQASAENFLAEPNGPASTMTIVASAKEEGCASIKLRKERKLLMAYAPFVPIVQMIRGARKMHTAKNVKDTLIVTLLLKVRLLVAFVDHHHEDDDHHGEKENKQLLTGNPKWNILPTEAPFMLCTYVVVLYSLLYSMHFYSTFYLLFSIVCFLLPYFSYIISLYALCL